MDPISQSAIEASTKGFVVGLIECAEKLIKKKFTKFPEKATENAEKNVKSFHDQLLHHITDLKEKKRITETDLANIQANPSFWVLFDKAIMSAAEIDILEKHELLARIVVERIKADSDDTISLASKMACEAIALLSVNQLKILALLFLLKNYQPDNRELDGKTNDEIQIYYQDWLIQRLKLFEDLMPKQIDLLHLTSVSCINLDIASARNLEAHLSLTNITGFWFDIEMFKKTETGSKIVRIWNSEIYQASLTSIGFIVGIVVYDFITGEKIDLSEILQLG